MVVSDAIVYGDKDFFLKFDRSQHPVALQIAGSNPKNLSYAAKCGEDLDMMKLILILDVLQEEFRKEILALV